MFQSASDFNGNISGWNVSAVTGMGGMFWGAEKFNSDLSGWNVSGVTDMHRMFFKRPCLQRRPVRLERLGRD